MLKFKRNDIVVFHLLDRAEIDLPFADLSRYVDTENAELTVTAYADQIRKAYRVEINAFKQSLEIQCTDRDVHYVSLVTDDTLNKSLEACLRQRKKKC